MQLLTIPKERALVKWIICLKIIGHPANHAFIKEIAEEIRQKYINKINKKIELISYLSINSTWIPRFINRHPQLETTLSQSIEIARVTIIIKSMMQNFFQ